MDREGDTLVTGEAFEGFDDEADTVTEQEPLPPLSSREPGRDESPLSMGGSRSSRGSD